MGEVFKYSGTIFSPNYPVPYPDDTLCVWRLYVPNKRMKIKVVDFELRGSSMGDASDDYCYFYMDHVEISDGWLLQENVYCGNQTAFEFYSDLGLMYVRFRTIPTGVRGKRGFKAHFEAVDPLVLVSVFDEELCLPHNNLNLNLKLSGSYGTLQSPMENYDPGLKCEWLITVPEEKVVELSFDRFQLHPSDPSVECLHNSLQVYEGERNTKGDSLGTYCDHVVPEPLTSSGRYMWVRFISEVGYDEKNPGFKATFKAVDKKNNYNLIIILGTVCGLIFLVIVVTGIRICRSIRKKARNTEAGVGIPLSTITTSASRTAGPRVVHDSPQPAGMPHPDPPLAARNTPESTIPVVPPYPGEESVPQYPPPGELYPWQQSSDSD